MEVIRVSFIGFEFSVLLIRNLLLVENNWKENCGMYMNSCNAMAAISNV